jgi:hypothetical protein
MPGNTQAEELPGKRLAQVFLKFVTPTEIKLNAPPLSIEHAIE